jgi:hypothetical protein
VSCDTRIQGRWSRPADPGMPLDVSGFSPVTLPEVMAYAAQLTRVDRKYLVPVDVAQAVLDRLNGSHPLLVIQGRQTTTYHSTYFDTPDLATARAHVQGRRRRWKARSRLYVEDQLCRLEVKSRDGRGATVKLVVDRDPAHHGILLTHDTEFIDAALRARSIPAPARSLHPAAELTYQRITLADLEHSARVTLDWDVRCELAGGHVWLDHDFVLMETKGGTRPGVADRILGAHRIRPSSFSKYVAGVSLLHSKVPANDFLPRFGRQLHSTSCTDHPDRSGSGDRTRTPAAAHKSLEQKRAS